MSQTNSPAPAISPLLTLDVEVEWLRNLAGTPLGERVIFGVRGGRFDGPHLRGHVLSWGGDSVTRTASTTQLDVRSEEHTSELQSLMRISYAVFCLKKKKQQTKP